MDYETLDKIADLYIPLLVMTALLASFLVPPSSLSRIEIAFSRLACLGILLGTAYGFMLLDGVYSIWPDLGLDYSTHTAVSLVLVLFLVLLIPRLLLLWSSSLIAYCGLMLYQEYHSVADILSTAFALFIIIPVAFSLILIGRKSNQLLRSE